MSSDLRQESKEDLLGIRTGMERLSKRRSNLRYERGIVSPTTQREFDSVAESNILIFESSILVLASHHTSDPLERMPTLRKSEYYMVLHRSLDLRKR